MKIVVTGGAGFLGRFIVRKLKVRNHEVIAPSADQCDLRVKEDIITLLQREAPDCIIHLAAVVGGIGANRENPGKFFYENAIMGIELIEQARIHNVRKFVAIGTICSYPKYAPVPFKEESLWDGYPEETNAPYGLAKKMMLVQLQAYRQQYGFNGIYLLPVNMYGPGDNFDLETSHVIPALIRKFNEAKESGDPSVTVWGTGNVTREFLYVEDAADAIIKATENYDGGEPINIGTGNEIIIRDLVEKIRHLTGFAGKIVWDTSRPDGQPRRQLDTSRAKELLDFAATTSLDEGLRKTLEWYKQQ